MKYMEYKEVKAPDKVLVHLEKKAEIGMDPTFLWQEAGYYDFLTELSKDGWRPIWMSLRFPFIIVEREIITEETEK